MEGVASQRVALCWHGKAVNLAKMLMAIIIVIERVRLSSR